MNYSPPRKDFPLSIKLLENKLYPDGIFFKSGHVFEFAKYIGEKFLMAHAFNEEPEPMEMAPIDGEEWKGSISIPMQEVQFILLSLHEVMILSTGDTQ